jgi:hypothetical protein
MATKNFPLRQLFLQTVQYVEEGERRIERQREILAELKADGHDTRGAQELLSLFLEVQELHVAHMRRLEREVRDCAR